MMACKGDPEKGCGLDKDTLWRLFESVMQACAAEFFGTTIYVFIACMVSAGVKGTGVIHQDHLNMAVPVALCAGFSVAALMAAFGKVSGGHFNPAVSISVCVAGGLPVTLLPIYLAMQILGGIAGAAVPFAILPDSLLVDLLENGVVELSVGPVQAVICEAMLTMMVVSVLLLTTVDDRTCSHSGPVAVGFTYVVGALAGMRTTGGCINPAHSFGSAVVLSCLSNIDVWQSQYIFWAGPIAGGVVFACLYRYVVFRPEVVQEDYKYIRLNSKKDQKE